VNSRARAAKPSRVATGGRHPRSVKAFGLATRDMARRS
jgi:hypothetical protein